MKDSEIQAIINRVTQEVGDTMSVTQETAVSRRHQQSPSEPTPAGGDNGVFPTLDEAVAAAGTAFRQLNKMPLEIRKHMVAHMRQAGREYAQVLAEMAQSESGMGRVADKTLKNILTCSTRTATAWPCPRCERSPA
jgi:acyl-CoA reductase-like NAD-dependent aldehyde dehydrogenase